MKVSDERLYHHEVSRIARDAVTEVIGDVLPQGELHWSELFNHLGDTYPEMREVDFKEIAHMLGFKETTNPSGKGDEYVAVQEEKGLMLRASMVQDPDIEEPHKILWSASLHATVCYQGPYRKRLDPKIGKEYPVKEGMLKDVCDTFRNLGSEGDPILPHVIGGAKIQVDATYGLGNIMAMLDELPIRFRHTLN